MMIFFSLKDLRRRETVSRDVPIVRCRVSLLGDSHQFRSQLFDLTACAGRCESVFTGFDRAVTVLDVSVVALDRLLRDIPRVHILVVHVSHHLGSNPH